MLNIAQFRELIVKSTLNDLLLYSENAEELLVFTCANESLGGTYLQQVNGPALGIYQMEPQTHTDIWYNYLNFHHSLRQRLTSNFNVLNIPGEERLIYDLRYATALARIYYARISELLPNAKDENAIWEYYKKYYNTSLGAATKDAAIKKYRDFLGG